MEYFWKAAFVREEVQKSPQEAATHYHMELISFNSFIEISLAYKISPHQDIQLGVLIEEHMVKW
jgi:hypothetical protein